MHPDGPALVWDALSAVELVRDFTDGKSLAKYRDDIMLRSAVERQLGIIGEALNRLSRVDPEAAATIPDLRRIAAFRNILVHGYAQIDDDTVWKVVTERLTALETALREASE